MCGRSRFACFLFALLGHLYVVGVGIGRSRLALGARLVVCALRLLFGLLVAAGNIVVVVFVVVAHF